MFHSSRSGNPDLEEAAVLLAQKAIETGLHRFVDFDALEQLLARSRFAASQGHGAALSMDDVERAVRDAAAGARSFAELERVDVLAAVKAKLPGRIDQVAPERIRLPGGRSVVVHYADGQPPWIASRLQDFFGMRETPRVGGVPVVVHLLAPNQRPVQMTTDLAGFWERLYPQVRRELGRRYPRHKWPENPV